MAKPKLKSRSKAAPAAAKDPRGVGKTVMDSAQQIWLAGLGAFAKAQEEGSKLFEALVKEGTALDARTRKFTEAKMNEARGNVETTLGQVRERSQETWDKLERVFEDRVSKALGRLGIPGRADLDRVVARVDELSREVRKLGGKPVAAKRPAARRVAK
ncbi:phasin family protein [Dokdonella fugitiva]|jgi:poly(hydroxyalkanoate) granule-associated protein|uniref:Poly(Hydroxyalkanoate) granule-associated protein n=1 Tax=Dokdonella fugitiva TaxID=328517 RepID=A0A4R2I9A1_9GAMM|nr:phasin family protein [Dokdonella fugitiva]MBA8883390.1 poly(hydroxyalkanoate) granule-associated protein [Dokdonella fugitiva]TCO40707.1 poly(hydroxyalkanoate) granule-associated protein [Dokdonella fugitiva]